MTRERALINALEIIETCKTHGNEDRCRQCPYNIKGCMVTDGNNVPTDWKAAHIVEIVERGI